MKYIPITDLSELSRGDTIRIGDNPVSYTVDETPKEREEDSFKGILAVRAVVVTDLSIIYKLVK